MTERVLMPARATPEMETAYWGAEETYDYALKTGAGPRPTRPNAIYMAIVEARPEVPENETAEYWRASLASFIAELRTIDPEALKAIRDRCFDDSDWARVIDGS